MHDALELTSHRDASGVQVVRLSGRLDSRSTPRFVRECPPPAAGEIVVVNLENVTFVSSSGVGALLAHSEVAREQGGEFRLASPPSVVMKTLKLLNLDEHLKLYPNEAEAVKRAA